MSPLNDLRMRMRRNGGMEANSFLGDYELGGQSGMWLSGSVHITGGTGFQPHSIKLKKKEKFSRWSACYIRVRIRIQGPEFGSPAPM